MNKTVIFTGYDEAYGDLAALTVPRMWSYAKRHGLDFEVYRDPPHEPNTPWGNMYWTGVCRAMSLLYSGRADRVLYLDVDQLITNTEVEILAGKEFGFHVSKDWGEDAVFPWQFSMCGFVCDSQSGSLLHQCMEEGTTWVDKAFQEQGPMQAVVRQHIENVELNKDNGEGLPGLINIHPRKVFNCVPIEVCPDKVPEPWRPGDFAAHLTMVDIPARVVLAQKLLSSLS